MNKIRNIFSLLILSFISIQSFGQLKKGDLVDGIAAVVGNEIVLNSDITEQRNLKQDNSTEKCDFMENLLTNKFLISEAKKDSLIENKSALIKEEAEKKYQQYLSQFPSEKEMLKTYKFNTASEMKSVIEQLDSDQYYGQAKFQKITQGVNVTPNEVTDFYNIYKNELPSVKDEITLAQISIFPKLTDAHKKELIDKLLDIKKKIQAGESFEQMAKIYSDDPGSASNGGLYSNISKGTMVKPFEAAALILSEGEISDPIETEFGFHLIQLIKKQGKQYSVRHILIKAEPNSEEILAAKKELENIKNEIKENKITFKEAAFKYSDDKTSKYNSGILLNAQDGSDKLDKNSLSATISYQIAGLKKDDMTDVFEEENEKKTKKTINLIKIINEIPAHNLDIQSDYERVKEYAINKKKNEVLQKWITERLPETFISISNQYSDCHFKLNWTKK